MKFQEKQSAIAVRVALGLLGGLVAFGAAAQSTGGEEPKVQRIEITGSNIKRIASETASAVQVISKKEILQSGATTVADVLQKISANPGSTLTDLDPQALSFAAGGSAANLRGLGESYTLVLVNGRRVSPFALASGAQSNFTNIDTIPADLIDRVEILKDGASAIYGSDAIAGVINFITKKEFQGVNLHATGQTSLKNSKLNRDELASITAGFGDLGKDNYNVFGNVEVYRRHAAVAADTLSDMPKWHKKYVDPNFGTLSSYSYPGNFVLYNEQGVPSVVPAKGCASENIIGGVCRLNQYKRSSAVPKSDRVNVTIGGRYNLNSETQLFFDANYSRNEASNPLNAARIGDGLVGSWYDTRRNEVKSYADPMLPAGNAYNPYGKDVTLRYRFMDQPNIFKTDMTNSQYRVMGGVEGSFGGWDYNSAVGVLGAKASRSERYWAHAQNLLNAINSGEYKFGGTNSSELLARMFPAYSTNGDTRTYFVDARASRELFKLDGGNVGIATGFEFRRFDFKMFSSENVLNSDILFSTPISVGGVQNQSAVYAELLAPVTKDLEVTGALRADKSGNAGLSVVPKLGLKYTIAKNLLVRGTVADGFRAPNAAESGKGSLSGFLNGIEDPKRCATAINIWNVLSKSDSDIDRALAEDARSSGCSVSGAVAIVSNPNLKPEKSRSATLGLVWEPSQAFSVGVDYFNIERRDEISTLDSTEILSKEDQNPNAVSRLGITAKDRELSARARQLNPAAQGIDFTIGRISTINVAYLNLYRTRVSGLDLDIKSRFNLGSAGKLNFGLDGVYMLDSSRWDSVLNKYAENLVGNYGTPRYRGRLTGSWEKAAWTVFGSINFTAKQSLLTSKLYDNSFTPETCAARGIPEENCYRGSDETFDFGVSYSGLKNTRFTVNVQNLFNRESIIDVRAGGSIRGRNLKIGAEYNF